MAEQIQTLPGEVIDLSKNKIQVAPPPIKEDNKRESRGSINESTERDTLAAKARLNTNNSTTTTSAEARVDTQRAQSRTKGGTGFDKLQRRIAAQENPQQQETLFTELQTPMTQHYFPVGTGGAAGLSGVEIIWADQTETFIRASDMLDNYDADTDSYWSAVFAVSNNTFTQATPTYDSTPTLWDDIGTDQTEYRLRLITQGLDSEGDPVNTAISVYGQYRESILCVNGKRVTVLVKIS